MAIQNPNFTWEIFLTSWNPLLLILVTTVEFEKEEFGQLVQFYVIVANILFPRTKVDSRGKVGKVCNDTRHLFFFSHSTNKVLELWQHHGLQSFPYHSQYTLIFLEIKAPKYCNEPSYLAKIILLKKNAQYTQRYCVMQVALGDRFWLFIQTLNNDKKPFNSIFNSKTKSN